MFLCPCTPERRCFMAKHLIILINLIFGMRVRRQLLCICIIRGWKICGTLTSIYLACSVQSNLSTVWWLSVFVMVLFHIFTACLLDLQNFCRLLHYSCIGTDFMGRWKRPLPRPKTVRSMPLFSPTQAFGDISKRNGKITNTRSITSPFATQAVKNNYLTLSLLRHNISHIQYIQYKHLSAYQHN